MKSFPKRRRHPTQHTPQHRVLISRGNFPRHPVTEPSFPFAPAIHSSPGVEAKGSFLKQGASKRERKTIYTTPLVNMAVKHGPGMKMYILLMERILKHLG